MPILPIARCDARHSAFEDFDAVTLSAGELRATFVPELGMVGASLTHAGEELLDRRHGLRAYRDSGAVMGLPLLHPWANRLSGDAYELHGRRVRLKDVTRDDLGLPIHGLLHAHPGWKVEFLTADDDGACLQASLDFAADPSLLANFPFGHELTIAARLTPHALTVTTTLTAAGGAPVPVSFGFHPYLRLPGSDRRRWAISLPCRRHLELDPRGIPTGRGRGEPATRFELAELAFDDGYDGLADGACFAVSDGRRTLTVTHHVGFPVAQVYSPRGAQFICFEPMTAPVDALRSAVGLRRAFPGAPFSAEFSVAVEAA
jgi:aldose 1-epimerase